MPKKRKGSNLDRRSVHAKQRRQCLSQETPEQTNKRLSQHSARARIVRSNETPEEREARLSEMSARARQHRANEILRQKKQECVSALSREKESTSNLAKRINMPDFGESEVLSFLDHHDTGSFWEHSCQTMNETNCGLKIEDNCEVKNETLEEVSCSGVHNDTTDILINFVKVEIEDSISNPSIPSYPQRCSEQIENGAFNIKRENGDFQNNALVVEKYISCELCTYKTKFKEDLLKHISAHTGGKHISSELYPYKAQQKKNLHMHVLNHTGEKIFSCNLCPYKAGKKSNMENHILIHTGVKPFSCKLCPYKARQRKNLKFHILTHTRENETYLDPYLSDPLN